MYALVTMLSSSSSLPGHALCDPKPPTRRLDSSEDLVRGKGVASRVVHDGIFRVVNVNLRCDGILTAF